MPWRFKKFRDSNSFWEQRYAYGGNSGKGSYGEEAVAKANLLNDLIRNLNIKLVIELGSGDGHNASMYVVEKYVGFDISKTAIEHCSKVYNHLNSHSFIHLNGEYHNNITRVSEGLEPDEIMVISFDVIFHLIEEHVFKNYMEQLVASNAHYALIYASNYDKEGSQPHVRHRNFVKPMVAHGWKTLPKFTKTLDDKHLVLFSKK